MLPPLLLLSTAERPCDITGKAGNPCVAAHSTTRALFAAYSGPLYQVTRASDGASADIPLLAPGGFANASAQDAFCAKDACVIARVYDQSPMGNHLGQRHKLVQADRYPLFVGKTRVYGMYFDPGYGYHVDYTRGVAKGNQPESIYAVMRCGHTHVPPVAPHPSPPPSPAAAGRPTTGAAASTTATARTAWWRAT